MSCRVAIANSDAGKAISNKCDSSSCMAGSKEVSIVLAVAENGANAFTIRASSNFGAVIADVLGAAIVAVDGEVKTMVSLLDGCPDSRSAPAGSVVDKHDIEEDSVEESKSLDFHAVAWTNWSSRIESIKRKFCIVLPDAAWGPRPPTH